MIIIWLNGEYVLLFSIQFQIDRLLLNMIENVCMGSAPSAWLS